MLTRSITHSWSSPGEILSKRIDILIGGESNIDETIPHNSNPLPVDFALDVSATKYLFMVSDFDVVVHTNDPDAPINTFTLSAGVPFVWEYHSAALRDTAGVAVVTDITSIYVVNASNDNDATLQIRAGYDPTP